jgi:hypothetical protein
MTYAYLHMGKNVVGAQAALQLSQADWPAALHPGVCQIGLDLMTSMGPANCEAGGLFSAGAVLQQQATNT